jgi:hypothetical protein
MLAVDLGLLSAFCGDKPDACAIEGVDLAIREPLSGIKPLARSQRWWASSKDSSENDFALAAHA